MKTIYTSMSGKVVVENGIVTHSDFDYCVVGQKPNIKALKACNWTKVKFPKVYYSHGGTNPTRFTK